MSFNSLIFYQLRVNLNIISIQIRVLSFFKRPCLEFAVKSNKEIFRDTVTFCNKSLVKNDISLSLKLQTSFF